MKEEIVGNNCHIEAKRRAKFGRRDWVCWIDRDGLRHAAPQTPDSVKSALLATGTQGKFLVYERNSGIALGINWRIGVRMMRQQQLYGI